MIIIKPLINHHDVEKSFSSCLGAGLLNWLINHHDVEKREHLEEALALAALKAKEGHRIYGLFCEGSEKPFASVNQMAWEILYGSCF